MFHLITKIKDKRPCRCCRHRNSTTFCFQQGNRIMYLFDEIWVCFFFCFFKKRFTILLISHTRRRICLNIRRLFWGVDDKVPSFFYFICFLKNELLSVFQRALKQNAKAAQKPRAQIKHHAPNPAMKNKLCQAGLTLTQAPEQEGNYLC